MPTIKHIIEKVTAAPRIVAVFLVKLYRYAISPFFVPCCRFEPSCSDYAISALHQYGFVYGAWLAIKRVMKCHPFHAGGYDPLPDNVSTTIKVNNQ